MHLPLSLCTPGPLGSMLYPHLLLTLIMGYVRHSSADKNFEMLFQSNMETYEDLPVSPESPLPEWLRGEYIRNGLGQFELGDRQIEHAFDAFGKICKFSFNGSSVLFSTKFIDTQFRLDSLAENSIASYLLFDAPIPPFSVSERMKAMMHGIDNTNINILPIKSASASNTNTTSWRYMAVSDFWQMYEFDARTLSTLGCVDPPVPHNEALVNQFLPLPLPSTAHPVEEYRTTNLISYVSVIDIRPWGQNRVNVIRIRDDESREVIASIPVDTVPYMHSLGASKKYAIILAHPLRVDIWKMAETANPSKSLVWEPEKMTQIYVVNLINGKLHTIKTRVPAKFNMHHINSYQIHGRRIIVDYVAYPDTQFIHSLKMKTLMNATLRNQIPSQAELVRYTIDLKASTAKLRHFAPTPGLEFVNTMDMPAINEAYRHKKLCFVYGTNFKADNENMSNTTLSKKNLCRAGRDRAWYEPGHYVSEPWFVARPGASKEDDGVLLSTILDGNTGKSYLGVLDARTMKMINRIYVPTAIPFSLHGRFMGEDMNENYQHKM